jgi:hypothetical protein
MSSKASKKIRIASWDVGIVNLSLCIMEKSNNKKIPYKIIKWHNIDLLKEDRKVCEDCGKEGKWVYKDDDDECHYFCGTHRNIEDILTLATNVQIKKNKCCHKFKIKNKKCNDNIKYALKSKNGCEYFCNKHKPHDVYNMQPHKKIGANKMPIDILQTRLIKRLEKLKEVFEVDRIVIENQPSLKAPKMKSIANTIFNYYLIRKILDKEKYKGMKIKTIVFQSPSNKLKLDDNNKLILDKTKGKQKYKMTKELAVKYCKKLLKHDQEHLDFLDSKSKKDDYCDSFLQGCYHLEYKYIPDESDDDSDAFNTDSDSDNDEVETKY